MSRLIVKNLPKTVTEEKLRGLFEEKGTLTDIQLKYKNGVFRRFAFVGYQTEEQAQKALKYFNNSYIQTSRVKVELCDALGNHQPAEKDKRDKDDEITKVTKEKKAGTKKKKDKLSELFEEHKNDPQFSEFLHVNKSGRTLWDNDAVALGIEEETEKDDQVDSDSNKDSDDENKVTSKTPASKKVTDSDVEDEESGIEQDAGNLNEKLAEKCVSDLDYKKSLMKKSGSKAKVTSSTKNEKLIDLFTIKIHDIPYKTKRQDIIKLFKPIKPYSVRLPTKVHGFCYVGFKTEKDFKRAMLKNKTFLKGKQLFFADFTEKNKITKPDSQTNAGKTIEHENKSTKFSKQNLSTENAEDISESGRIFFRNLSYTVTEDDLTQLFEQYGPIAEINLPVDHMTGRIKGFGTVTFVMPEHAVQVFSKLDGSLFHGRLLHLIPGKSKDDDENQDLDENSTNFKAKKALKLKKSAEKSHNWNTLFLGTNAVAETLSKNFSTTKEVILDPNAGGSGAAVRLALGETKIIMEMRKFLKDNDVHLDAFNTTTIKRSKTVILVKNLPSGTVVSDLTPLFSKFGQLGRLVLPPSGVTAIVEYLSPTEARQAFKKLAYSKFNNLPLYLEWAPENTFKNKCDKNLNITTEENVENDQEKNENIDENTKEALSTNERAKNTPVNIENHQVDDTPPEPNTTIFLRNLNFKTQEPAIRAHFESLGCIHLVQVATRKDPENPRNRVSLGYGFIQFKENKTAEKALKEMQCTMIEGNQVELKRSDRILKSDENARRKHMKNTAQTGTKILVRNIPFQAKSSEIRDIFKTFGELNSVRLPKKMTPGEESHRGFGFVDFVTKECAKQAFDALCHSTHLYGRRLVLEWAAVSDDDVGNLRKRTAETFHANKNQNNKKQKGVFDSSTIHKHKEDNDEEENER